MVNKCKDGYNSSKTVTIFKPVALNIYRLCCEMQSIQKQVTDTWTKIIDFSSLPFLNSLDLEENALNTLEDFFLISL